MIRLICFLKRKPDSSPEAFRDHWRNRHGPLVAATPDFARHIQRYEQNARLPGDYARDDGGGFDGVTVQWFESPREFLSMTAEPGYQQVIFADEERFLDRAGLLFVLTGEPAVVIDAGSARESAPLKVLSLLRRKQGSSPDEFRRHWHERHGPIFRDTPELARHIAGYEQHPRLERDYRRDEGGGFDGVAEMWFESSAELRALLREPAFRETVSEDERRFIEPAQTVYLFAGPAEVVIP